MPVAQYVSIAGIERARRSLAAFGRRMDPVGGQHILPLLALKRAGVNRETEVRFEERDDFRFWDHFFLLDEHSQIARYYDPILETSSAAAYPHSHVASMRKATFANAWRAGTYRLSSGETTWRLAEDYLRIVRERALTSRGVVTLIPALDLALWLWRSAPLPEGAGTSGLIALLRREFNLNAHEMTALFDLNADVDGAPFNSHPVPPEEVRRLILEVPTGDGPVAPAVAASLTVAASPAAPTGARVAERLVIDTDRLGAGFALPTGVVRQAAAALEAGSHLILAGPPGTGKSTLAALLAEEATRDHFVSGFLTATATAEWTTFDTVGGYVPTGSGNELAFQEGVVLRSIEQDSWCVMDELNRANIDRAIGPLLTLLAGSEQSAVIELPQRHAVGSGHSLRLEPVRIRRGAGRGRSGKDDDSGDYVIGRNWRLVATMNTFDRGSLFPLTAAFARRFATVYVGIPPVETALDVLGVRSCIARAALGVIMTEFEDQWQNPRPLGPAIVKDAWAYVRARLDGMGGMGGMGGGALETQAVLEGFAMYVLPQYSGLEAWEWEPLRDRVLAALLDESDGSSLGERDGARYLDRAMRGISGQM